MLRSTAQFAIIGLSGLLLAAPAAIPQTAPDQPTSLVITGGGIYSGHWESDDPDIPAVTIRTTEPVTLEDCVVSGVGTLISTRYGEPADKRDGVNPRNTDGADLTVRNCTAEGLRPELRDRAPPRFLVVRNPRRVDVQHNTIEGTRGIWVYADPTRTPASEVTIRYNTARNLDGRCWETCSKQNVGAWTDRSGIAVANFVQLADIREASAVDVSWNYVRNEPGNSAVEDLISLFRVRGTADRPVTVSNNLLIGAFPGHEPYTGRYSGAGIVIDGMDMDETTAPAWTRTFSNIILYASNAGIGIAAGNNNEVFENVVVRPPHYSDGTEITTKTVGIYVWRCCGEDVVDDSYFANVARSNSIYVESYRDGNFTLNNLWLPDCAVNSAGDTLCVANESLPSIPAEEVEARLVSEWEGAREASLQ